MQCFQQADTETPKTIYCQREFDWDLKWVSSDEIFLVCLDPHQQKKSSSLSSCE